MKVIFDNIIFSLQKTGGISVYWQELISRFCQQYSESGRFLEISSGSQNLFRNTFQIPQDSIIKEKTILPIQLIRYLPVYLKGQEQEIFHSSYYRVPFTSGKKLKKVLTVHDFTYEKFTSGLQRSIHTTQKRLAIAAADSIICVSESTRKDLFLYYPGYENKDIRVIYNGVSGDYKPIQGEPDNKSDKPFILFVGSRAGYKNFNLTLDLLSALPDYDLVLTGKPLNPAEKSLLENKLPGRYRVFSDISNAHLNKLYNSAYCLFYPSLYEGFGIPVLEAMKAGCPVITLNNSSLPEVSGNAGIMLEEPGLDLFVTALDYIRMNRPQLIKSGLLQADRFSWDKCYEETIGVYKELGFDK